MNTNLLIMMSFPGTYWRWWGGLPRVDRREGGQATGPSLGVPVGGRLVGKAGVEQGNARAIAVVGKCDGDQRVFVISLPLPGEDELLSLIHISEPTRRTPI